MEELRVWLENMVVDHKFSIEEVRAATGLAEEAITAHLQRFGISRETRRRDDPWAPLRVLPYPGGRHPRIGFLEGAVRPQRETKLSVFTPWDPESYVVLDVPEAIWSNLGLTYLAHTHIPTIFDEREVVLEKLEWRREGDVFALERTLPNGIRFATRVRPLAGRLQMEMMLHNGTDAMLSDLRVQNCAMLKGARGFTEQTNDNKLFWMSYSAARTSDGRNWLIMAWDPIHRPWANERCPCVHADPIFPDCPPGETRWLRGWFSFYRGVDIIGELERIEASDWKQAPAGELSSRRRIEASVVDPDGRPLAARVQIRGADGTWHRVDSVGGSAAYYERIRRDLGSEEVNTTLSADPFEVWLAPGHYEVFLGRGKEYRETRYVLEVPPQGEIDVPKLQLTRLLNATERGWYSGDTHTHRDLADLPNVLIAEDLNVAFPLTRWVTVSGRKPTADPKPGRAKIRAEVIEVDDTHVIWPLNTEYEIFTTRGRQHTLGAVFVLNQQQELDLAVPPVEPVAVEARRQGALLDLDKHSWPWSLMVAPVMDVDLFELANNHHWETQFGYRRWTRDKAAEYMKLEMVGADFSEDGWTDFGFQAYYALLNHGLRMRVSAGTASGVHPVQLGFNRVYVQLEDGFSYRAWLEGLDAGRSFATNGPFLFVEWNGQPNGTTFRVGDGEKLAVRIVGECRSLWPLSRLEIVSAGRVVHEVELGARTETADAHVHAIDTTLEIDSSTWLAVRAYEKTPAGRTRFAHGNPVWIDVENRPLRPRPEETAYLLRRMDEEIERNRPLLDEASLDEYRKAKRLFEQASD